MEPETGSRWEGWRGSSRSLSSAGVGDYALVYGGFGLRRQWLRTIVRVNQCIVFNRWAFVVLVWICRGCHGSRGEEVKAVDDLMAALSFEVGRVVASSSWELLRSIPRFLLELKCR